MTASHYSANELDRFRRVQRLAYDAAEQVAGELEVGTTEIEAARRLDQVLRARGVQRYFHQPFAWFGDRSRFRGFRRSRDFFPSRRKLARDMAAILDVGPMIDGYAADIGYAFAHGDNPIVEEGLDALEGFRSLVVERVMAGDTLGEIYRRVDELLHDLGYQNCHRKYPFGVLAHRVYRQPRGPVTRNFLGFAFSASMGLLAQEIASRVPAFNQRSPFMYTGPGSDVPPEPGLWAVEPHIGREDVGVKWEELLVIDDERAYWLDDDLPHVRRWAKRRDAGAA